MGDFERTFGAGADAADIIDGFSRARERENGNWEARHSLPATGRPTLEQSACPKCGGAGRIGIYKHIENGKCFACGGSGVAWSKKESPQKLSLSVTLAEVKNLAPKHDCFGDLRVEYNKNYSELISRLGEPIDPYTRVSIGDVAKAFGPCDAVNLALQTPGVDRQAILKIVTLAASRAAIVSKEFSLAKSVSIALNFEGAGGEKSRHKSIFSTWQEYILAAWSGRSRMAKSAKTCGAYLTKAVEVFAHKNDSELKLASMVMTQVCYVFQDYAKANGASGHEAFEAERRRQQDDVIAAFPLSIASTPSNHSSSISIIKYFFSR